jgi:hypothetical protein
MQKVHTTEWPVNFSRERFLSSITNESRLRLLITIHRYTDSIWHAICPWTSKSVSMNHHISIKLYLRINHIRSLIRRLPFKNLVLCQCYMKQGRFHIFKTLYMRITVISVSWPTLLRKAWIPWGGSVPVARKLPKYEYSRQNGRRQSTV